MYRDIEIDVYINTHTQFFFSYLREQEMMTKEKSHSKFFVTGNFCCWSEVLFSAKHMKNGLSPWQSFILIDIKSMHCYILE